MYVWNTNEERNKWRKTRTFGGKQNNLTLKPPAVPALMIRSGCNAWTDAYVSSDEETVPTLSTPGEEDTIFKHRNIEVYIY